MKKFFKTICGAMLLLGLTFSQTAQTTPICVQAETQKTPIDVYLIGGQSNAVGYSTWNGQFTPETFDNIRYVGEVNRRLTDATAFPASFSAYQTQVGVGLGRSANHIGPEYGIASVLNAYYESSEREAIIFKSGAGGTALQNVLSGESATFGNWYPRSQWNGSTPDAATSPMGVQYANFVANFEKMYDELVLNGYQPEVKGMVWMQGCADLGNPSAYESLLIAFISDIRTDLISITGDADLSVMPFVIGEIATTFSSYNNSYVPAFNTVQRNVAAAVTGAATVGTSDLIIVGQNGVVGTDQYHFNGNDMRTLGVRFGQKLVELSDKYFVSVDKAGEGDVSYELNAAKDKLTVTVTPANSGGVKYRLKSLYVNGVDVTEQVEGGRFVLQNPTRQTTVSAVFEEETKHSVSYEMDLSTVAKVSGEKSVYHGDRLVMEFAVAPGYVIESVKVNGAIIRPDPQGRYTVGSVKEDLTVVVTTKKAAQGGGGSSGGGCGGAMSALSVVPLTAALGLIVARKRKKG